MISAMLCVGMGFLLDEENTGCAGHAMSSSLATAPSLCDAGAWDGGVLKMGAMRATLHMRVLHTTQKKDKKLKTKKSLPVSFNNTFPNRWFSVITHPGYCGNSQGDFSRCLYNRSATMSSLGYPEVAGAVVVCSNGCQAADHPKATV